MIELDGVSVESDGTALLDRVTLRVAAGHHAVIGGPTGSGKSTVLLAIAGFHRLSAGRIRVDGEEVTPRSVRRVRRRIAAVDQEPVLPAGTARAALLAPFGFAANRGLTPGEDELDAVLDSVGLGPHILSRDGGVLSGGEKQRLALARALLLRRPVLLLDEVTSALDESTSQAILERVRALPVTILAVSHDPRWLAGFDSAYRIARGRVTTA